VEVQQSNLAASAPDGTLQRRKQSCDNSKSWKHPYHRSPPTTRRPKAGGASERRAAGDG